MEKLKDFVGDFDARKEEHFCRDFTADDQN
jgi:hypothetical protein